MYWTLHLMAWKPWISHPSLRWVCCFTRVCFSLVFCVNGSNVIICRRHALPWCCNFIRIDYVLHMLWYDKTLRIWILNSVFVYMVFLHIIRIYFKLCCVTQNLLSCIYQSSKQDYYHTRLHKWYPSSWSIFITYQVMAIYHDAHNISVYRTACLITILACTFRLDTQNLCLITLTYGCQ